MTLKPVTSEKAVKMIELDNTLLFEAPRIARRDEIKREVEAIFNVKVQEVRTMIKQNKKFAYVRLVKANPAIDIATKLGMI
ncbi:50S ribosomal protein L23 [Candidatus Pacearchaeota archaeon]|nr:50S ribosomal protein L23 [Candidatus Pacearchaeota archaeon]